METKNWGQDVMYKEMTCIVCPEGCILRIEEPEGTAVTAENVSGNKCKRGAAYAVNECTNPVRTLTTTVKIDGGSQRMAPVKSSKPLPKGMLFDCMEVINTYTAKAPLNVGDVVVENILGTGIDIISTSNIPEA
jgi:CxxC motif-containing protein